MANAKEMDAEKKQDETADIENSEPLKETEPCKEDDKKKEKEETPLDKALRDKEEYLNALMRERADFENFKKKVVDTTSDKAVWSEIKEAPFYMEMP